MGLKLQVPGFLIACALLVGTATPSSGWQRQVEVVGHKGAATAPENTIASCIACFEQGADAVEIDVRTTADGVLVNFHDGVLDNRTDGKGSLASHTLAELKQLDAGSWYSSEFAGERIPTLEEMLQLAKSWKKRVYLDVKLASVESIASVVAATEFPVEDLVILAWSVSGQLEEHLATFPGATVIHAPCCPNVLPASWSPAYFDDMAAIGVGGMAFNHTNLTPAFLNDARAAGMPIITYTVNDMSVAQELSDRGVSAIITDYSGIMLNDTDWDSRMKTRSLSWGAGGLLTIQWRAMVGQSYRVEQSPTLAPASWTPLTTMVADEILPTFAINPLPRRGFFRVVEQ